MVSCQLILLLHGSLLYRAQHVSVELYVTEQAAHSHDYCMPQVNLEVLWVNDNNLESISGLNSNFRMRTLHAEV